MQTNILKITNSNKSTKIAVTALAGMVIFIAFYLSPLPAIDWRLTYSLLPAHWPNPYAVGTFVNPPYVLAFILYAFLPFRWSNAFNAAINIGVLAFANHKYNGGRIGLLLIFTSAYFINMASMNNIDWIPLLGLLCPPWLGIILISVKPQAMAGVGLIWLKRHGPKILLPVIGVIAASLIIWHGWIFQWLASERGMSLQNVSWNYSPFPYLIPLGLFMLWKAWKSDDEILAAMSTACFMPYFGMYTLTTVIAITGKKYRAWAIALWLLSWVMVARNIILSR